MKALVSGRDFVRNLVLRSPATAPLPALSQAPARARAQGCDAIEGGPLSRADERVIAAIAEESEKVLRIGHPEIVAAAFNLVRSPEHRDHGRAVFGLLDRLDPVADQAPDRRHPPHDRPRPGSA